MQNTVRDEAQAGIRIARRNINNLRYADGITPMAGSKEELKSLSKTKIMASGLIASWQIDGETMETVRDFILGGSKIIADGDCSHEVMGSDAMILVF